MDRFEEVLGYRSLFPVDGPSEKPEGARLSAGNVLQMARDRFDAALAEHLRATGTWHWKIETREVAQEVAATISGGEQVVYEAVRSALLRYYAEQYRRPTPREYRAYLRGKRAGVLSPKVTASCHSDDWVVSGRAEAERSAAQQGQTFNRGADPMGGHVPFYRGAVTVELTGLAAMRQRRTITLAEPLTAEAIERLARETAGNHLWEYMGMQDETVEVVIMSNPS